MRFVTKHTRNRFNTATCHGQLPGTVGRPPIIRMKYDNLEPLWVFATPHLQTFEFFSRAKLSTVLGLSSNSSNTKSKKIDKTGYFFLNGKQYPVLLEYIYHRHLPRDYHESFDGSIFGRSYLRRNSRRSLVSHRARKYPAFCTIWSKWMINIYVTISVIT